MNSRAFPVLMLVGACALIPVLASAQVIPPPGGQRQRMELERRLQQGFQRSVQNQLGLDDATMQAVRTVMQSFQEDRRSLNRDQASLRYRLRDPGLPEISQEDAGAMLQEMVELQERELDLYRREQAELINSLSPVQLLLFYRAREELGQRVQQLRQGRGMPGGGPGGGPAGRPGGVAGLVDGSLLPPIAPRSGGRPLR